MRLRPVLCLWKEGVRDRRGYARQRDVVSGELFAGKGHCISRIQPCLVKWVHWTAIRIGGLTERHAGPETRTTAIAALPDAVDRAYIVESASSINGLREDVEKLLGNTGCVCSVDGRGIWRPAEDLLLPLMM